jgi:hypothetical protein
VVWITEHNVLKKLSKRKMINVLKMIREGGVMCTDGQAYISAGAGDGAFKIQIFF